jgi:hypothetical protein
MSAHSLGTAACRIPMSESSEMSFQTTYYPMNVIYKKIYNDDHESQSVSSLWRDRTAYWILLETME